MRAGRLLKFPGILLLLAGAAHAQNVCSFGLADQSDGATSGFIFSLLASADSNGNCQLSSVMLRLAVGDGKTLHNLDTPFSFQTGVVYTATATVSTTGSLQTSLNGQPLGSAQHNFQPSAGTLFASDGGNSGTGTPTYVITQISLQVSNGSTTVSLAPNGTNPIPLPLMLMSDPPSWTAPFTEDPTHPLTITATFRFDPAVANPHQYDPYIDAYGQTVFTTWPGKAATDADLQSAVTEEQTWLADNGPIGGLDLYGGSLLAGWNDKATGYFHTAFHNNRWWLISPLGNPLFYIGLDTIGVNEPTPITGRQSMFENLPPMTGAFASAYSRDSQNNTTFSYATSNAIRKYGSATQASQANLVSQRLASWVFAGSGKWGEIQPGLAANPVLTHNAVPNVVPGGHPDAWDPNILQQLNATLTSQIGSNVTNPYIIGWTVGNEIDEVIAAQEVTGILALGASVPAKQALVNQALSGIYSGSVSALAAAWKITATTVAAVYASNPTPPAADVGTLRQFYEGAWYADLYQTVKAIDPNHLYLGSWTLPKDHPAEWPIMAANCDVIGFDFYNQTFLDPGVQALIQSTKKPVLVGEFSFPSDYGGMRGFGSLDKDVTYTDAQSGQMYAKWLQDAAANPYVVGVEWFEYHDQPVTGNANNGDVMPASVVIGQNQAFGMLDVTLQPKYDLVNAVRAANIAALQSLGLLGTAPMLTSVPANGATYLSGGLVPGSWAQVKGSNLSDISRSWAAADFANLGNALPMDLSGVQVLVNGTVAAVSYISPTQINFQVPAGVSGAASVQVTRDGLVSNAMSAPAVSSAPGIFPVIVNGTNYAAGVFTDGKLVGDPSVSSVFRNAKPGDAIALFATGLAPSPAGTAVSVTPLSGATVTIGSVTVNPSFAGLVAVGEFQINFTLPQQFANMQGGNYPITISINGMSSPSMINSVPPAPVVLPIQP
jgi:uncharacterized protein (TIGR03437 family)